MLNGLDLFSGIGGITVALAPWVRPITYCEIDRYAQAVLLSKMGEGKLPIAPIWDDVRTLNRLVITGHAPGQHDDGEYVDIITGGFPCQDISSAGLGRGLEGERSGLFFEILRLTDELRPRFIFLENVPAITFRGGPKVVGEITSLGYDCRWCVIESGHTRSGFKGERWFLLAKATGERFPQLLESRGVTRQSTTTNPGSNARVAFQIPEVKPFLCGAPYGLPYRMDRIKCLGNAVVPLQAKTAFEILMGVK